MNVVRKYISDFGNVIKNFSYTLSYQILSLILPIVTVPYITRVFSQDTVGMYTVISANCSYFVLVGMLGVTLLGPREIAKCLNDKEKLGKTFSSIYKIQFIFHIFAILAYIIYCIVSGQTLLKYIYTLYLISSMFDISWFYIGIEDFKNVSLRNVIIKLASFFLLFAVVKSDIDVYIYVCTLYMPQIIVNGYMWYLLLKKNIRVKVTLGIDHYYLKEAISLFVPQIAASIYTILDKTVLGIFTTYTVAAVYAQGQTLIKLFLAVVPSFSKIMAPRIANCIERNANDEVNKYMKMSANVIGFLSFLLAFGVLGSADLFVSWYLPDGYAQTAEVLKICSPIIIMVSGANLISVQYLIPRGKQKIYTISVLVATITNLILNFGLTPIIGIYGVCISSVFAETLGFLIQVLYVKKYLNLKKLFSNLPIHIIAGIIMYVITKCLTRMFSTSLMSVVLIAIIGSVIYTIISVFLMKLKRVNNPG